MFGVGWLWRAHPDAREGRCFGRTRFREYTFRRLIPSAMESSPRLLFLVQRFEGRDVVLWLEC